MSGNGIVTLRPVTRHNLAAVLALDAGDGGKQVASNAKSMAQAAVCAEAWPRAIYAGETPVGFLMLSDPSLADPPDADAPPEPTLWRMMIDKGQHRRGHGHAALQLLIAHVRTRPHRGVLLTSIVEPAPQLLAFYGAVGFVPTDRFHEGERVLSLDLP